MKRHLTIDDDNCTGCGACAKKCPVHAIEWLPDAHGFPFPRIDEQKCIECGMCSTVCQLHRPKSANSILGAFAVQLKDHGILMDSSSGGAFTAIAQASLADGGVVYGCVFDESCTAVYARASSAGELAPMRGSKYVWADASESYGAVRSDLDTGRPVLFCALPCQVSGLKLYLGRDYPNLATMDFLCGGPPSPAVFDAYVGTLVPRNGRKGMDFKFRDKALHGTGYCISYRKNGKKTYIARPMSSYLYLFSEKLLLREACYHCRHRGVHRDADLTIGDYWGAKAFFPEWDCNAGVSFVIANSGKGLDLFRKAEPGCRVRETRVEDIARHNIIRPDDSVKEIPVPAGRGAFFATFQARGYRMAAWRHAVTLKRLKAIVSEWLRGRRPKTHRDGRKA
jgi:coenzyme F420-reducing hydrogenase beta subunit